jgi:dethiobiotin synthetase
MSPLGETVYNIDLAAEFGFPLVIVAANELGAINAVLQTVITAQTRAPRLSIPGIVLNQTARREGDVSLATNAEEIAARCNAPLLACVGFEEADFAKDVDWYALACTHLAPGH